MIVDFPYPKKATISTTPSDAYMDGGTTVYDVLNKDEIGIARIYKDGRMRSSTLGRFFTAYPDNPGAREILPHFIQQVSTGTAPAVLSEGKSTVQERDRRYTAYMLRVVWPEINGEEPE